ncbi:MAG: DUF4124 domain-containing protein, partial [Gammaproteobacteria bacterium]
NPMIALMLAGSLLLLQSPAAADVYKWADENNEVQYTQMPPPPGIHYVRIQTTEHPDTGDAKPQTEVSAAGATPGKSQQQADAEAIAAYEAEVARISRENCKIARNNLEQLNMGGHLRYRNEEGEYVTMKEEERQQRIAEANKQIEQFCEDEDE